MAHTVSVIFACAYIASVEISVKDTQYVYFVELVNVFTKIMTL